MKSNGTFIARVSLGTAVLVAGFAGAVDAKSGTTAVGRFIYDDKSRTLQAPWSGARPSVETFTEPQHNVAFAEFRGPSGKSTLKGRTQSLNPDSKVLDRILHAQNREGVVRIAVRGDKKIRLVPTIKGKDGKGVVIFKVADWVGKVATGKRRWKLTTYDHNHVGKFSMLFGDAVIKLPISGPRPTWTIVKEAEDLEAVDINGEKGIPAFLNGKTVLTHVEGGTKYKRIHLARNRKGVVRLSFRGLSAPNLQPRLIPQGTTGKGWILVFGEPPAPEPVAAVPAPEPVPTAAPPAPEPEPIAVVTTPAEEPAPPAPPAPPPVEPQSEFEPDYPSRITLEGRAQNLFENIPDAGAFNIDVQSIRTGQLYWRHRLMPNLATEVDLRGWETYTVRDLVNPASLHHRTEGYLRLGAMRSYQLMGLTQSLYGGWMVRGVSVSNTLEPIVPEFMFSRGQLYTGPVLGNAVAIPVFGPLSLTGQIQAQPALWSWLDSDVDPLPLMFGIGGEVGLEAAHDHYVARLSYRFDTLRPMGLSFQDQSSLGLAIGYRY